MKVNFVWRKDFKEVTGFEIFKKQKFWSPGLPFLVWLEGGWAENWMVVMGAGVLKWKWKLLTCFQLLVTHSPGQNTGVGSLSLLQGPLPNPGIEPGLPHCGRILYQLSHKGSPGILEWVAHPFSRGLFPTQESNRCLLYCRQILYQLSHRGSPRILKWVAHPFSRRIFPAELWGKPRSVETETWVSFLKKILSSDVSWAGEFSTFPVALKKYCDPHEFPVHLQCVLCPLKIFSLRGSTVWCGLVWRWSV